MPLLGPAAMLLSFDVEAAAVAEHDHWHSYEHLPERLSIPGFLRGTRWAAVQGTPRYMVLYEVAALETLSSPAYLQRLNSPTPWTQQMMKHYRGMSRGLCTVAASEGPGLGGLALLVRFSAAAGAGEALEAWLQSQVLSAMPGRPGLCSAHLLRGAARAAMTQEQSLRGADAGVDQALLLTAADAAALARAQTQILSADGLQQAGGTDVRSAVYALHHTVSREEFQTAAP